MASDEFELLLVPARDVDRTAVTALVNQAFARYDILSGDRTNEAGLAEEAGDSGEFLQLWRGAAMVGSALIRPAADYFGDGAGPETAGALYFGLAAVQRSEMGGGIGRRLLAEAERIAAERRFTRVVLGTVREFGLVEYYARLGYIVYHHEDQPAGHWGLTVPHRYCDMVKAL